jgi:hypothetical protein
MSPAVVSTTKPPDADAWSDRTGTASRIGRSVREA